jgi:hypothetical protein
MAAATHDIIVEQGSVFELFFEYKDCDDVLIDLTGYTAQMQIREEKDSLTFIVTLSETDGITLGGALGTVLIRISADLTEGLDFKKGVYDVELAEAGDATKTRRVLEGKVKFSKQVTR